MAVGTENVCGVVKVIVNVEGGVSRSLENIFHLDLGHAQIVRRVLVAESYQCLPRARRL